MILIDENGNRKFIHFNDIQKHRLNILHYLPEKITLEIGIYSGYMEHKKFPLKLISEVSSLIKEINIDDRTLKITISGKTLDVIALAYLILTSTDGVFDNFIIHDAKMINLLKLNKGFAPEFSILLDYIAEKSMSDVRDVTRTISHNISNAERRKEIVAFLEKAFEKVYGLKYEEVLGKRYAPANVKPEIVDELRNVI